MSEKDFEISKILQNLGIKSESRHKEPVNQFEIFNGNMIGIRQFWTRNEIYFNG